MRKSVIAFWLVLGLAINQIILYQLGAVYADNSVIPAYIMNDIQKDVGYANNSYEDQKTTNHSVEYLKQGTMNSNIYQQQAIGYDPYRPEWKDFAPYGWDNVTIAPKEGTYWAYSQNEFS